MKKFIFCAILLATFTFSAELLRAQNPTTLICEGTLTDIDGNFVSGEDCLVSFSLTNSKDKVLFENEYTLTSDNSGELLFVVKNLPALFTDDAKEEFANLEINLKSAENSSWLEEGEFSTNYKLVRKGADDFVMTRYEGQTLNFSLMSPVWEFSDIYPLGYLSSRFMISFSSDIADEESIILICKMMHGDDANFEDKETAPPSKRGIKGGYAVGGYKK
jgi:hypothetical protein